VTSASIRKACGSQYSESMRLASLKHLTSSARCSLLEGHGVAPLAWLTTNSSATRGSKLFAEVRNQQLSLTTSIQTIIHLLTSSELSSRMLMKVPCSDSDHLPKAGQTTQIVEISHALVFTTSWWKWKVQGTQASRVSLAGNPISR